jgi:preprotein translocase subunit SecE
MSLKSYFTESYSELKKVNWPTRQETLRLTGAVVAVSVVVAVLLGVLDIAFTEGLKYFIF